MTPALVIGGGLAGAGAAIALAQAGRPVRLFERERAAHDKVCGGFLSFEAVASLRRLGLDPAVLGAQPIARLSVHAGARAACGVDLPFAALSLSRRALDEALLQRARDAGVEVRRGVRVTGLSREARGWTVRTDEGPERSPTVLLATGKRDLKGWRRPPGLQPDLIGFQQHLRLAPLQADALHGAVELHLFPGGYAGLEPVEGGLANLCLVVRRSAFGVYGGAWPALLAAIRAWSPALDARLAGAAPQGGRPAAVAAIPYGYIARAADGLWRLGDQAAVIPSFAGEGMSIALHSAEKAAAFVTAGRSAHAYQRDLARDLSRQVLGATLVSHALVRPGPQTLIGRALAVAPGLATVVARHTRLRAA